MSGFGGSRIGSYQKSPDAIYVADSTERLALTPSKDGQLAVQVDTNEVYSWDAGGAVWVIMGSLSPSTVSDTNTIDHVVTAGVLSSDVQYQDSNSVDLSDDASGLKADVVTQNTNSVNLSEDASGVKADLNIQDTSSVDLTVDGSGLKADVLPAGVDHDALLNTHDLTTDVDHDSITNTHNLTSDVDHDSITNTHNLTSDVDHASITNTHNLTTDIDHDQLTNFDSAEHFTEGSIDHNSISGKQGGTTSEYYHLTSAEHTIATQAAGSAADGYITTGAQNVAGNKTFDNDVIVTGDLTVNGTTVTLNVGTLDVEDVNITVNNGGNQASADDAAGLTVEMSDATDAKIIYDKDVTSRFKVGDSGSEVEVADISSSQSLTNKTIDADSNTVSNIANDEIKAAAAIDAAKIADGSVSNTEFQHISTVSSNVQSQLDACIHDNVASEISAVSEKATPINADLLLIEDSADSNNKKRVQIGNLPGAVSNTDYIESSFQAYVKPATANTSLTDNSNTNPRGLKFADLRYQAGRSRIEVYSIELTDENLGDDLPVWKIGAGCGPKGFRDQVRFVGPGWVNQADVHGVMVWTAEENDYILITGVMDDLSLIVRTDSSRANDVDVQVDGVDTGTNLSFVGSAAYNNNFIRTMTQISDSSISTQMGGLDLHTVKIVCGDSGSNFNMNIYGFELIVTGAIEQAGDAFVGATDTSFSQNTSVSDPTLSNGMGAVSYRYIDDADSTRKWASTEPATASTTLTANFNFSATQMQVASTASFAVDDLVLVDDDSLGYTISELFRVASIDSGTLMTMTVAASRTTQAGANHNFASGESVTLYGKCDTAVDHSDEQISKSTYPGMFGGGDGSDFQYAANTGFGSYRGVLDDGISSLWGNDCLVAATAGQIQSQNVLTCDDGTTNKLAYIFNGTGLDIVVNTNATAADADYYIDGVKVYDHTKGAAAEFEIIKLASGLPVGTHSLVIHQMSAVAGQNTPHIARFIEYIPEDPSAIDSADEGNVIARRDFCADYVFNSGIGLDDFSKGVNYYNPTKGWKLTDSSTAWTVPTSNESPFYDFLYGIYNSTNAIAETWFYGTGFEIIALQGSSNGIQTLTLNGSTDFSGYTMHQSGQKFTAATGKLDSYGTSGSVPYKVGVTGLTLGWHKLTVTQPNEQNGSSGGYRVYIAAFGVIGGSATLTSPVGSLQQICTANAGDSLDIRKVKSLASEENKVNYCAARGITSSPTTTSTSPVTIPDMTVDITTNGGPIHVSGSASLACDSANANLYTVIYIDGVQYTASEMHNQAAANNEAIFSFNGIINAVAGMHSVSVSFQTNSGTLTASLIKRHLIAVELPGVKNENS